jgi:predicted aspartyl protease
MNKSIISSHFPFLPLHLKLKLNKNNAIDTETEALVDTGFSGDIVVPSDWTKNGHRADGYVTWTMADGTSTMAEIYLGIVRLFDLEEGKPVLRV